MSDLIDRANLLAEIQLAIEDSGCVNHEREIIDCVRYAPTIDAVPVVHARWINEPERLGRSHGTFKRCSACGDGRWNGWSTDSAYCGMCGARMDADALEQKGWAGMNHWRETLNRDNPHLSGDAPTCVPFRMYRNGKSESWVINPSKNYPGAYDLSRLTFSGRQVVNGAQTPEQCLIMAYQHM